MTEDEFGLVLARLTQAHREEMSRLRALVLLYRQAIEDAGLLPPCLSGAEALQRFRHVFELAGRLDEIQAPELLADWSCPV